MATFKIWRAALTALCAAVAVTRTNAKAVTLPVMGDEVLRRAEVKYTELLDGYDFVIVGGGQSGVVIGSRLSEDPDVTVLIIEHGYFNTDPSVLQPPSATNYQKRVQYNMTSLPQPELDGYKQDIYAANCVGGGSTINGMLLNRGSSPDYDAWEALGNEGWGWDGLYPYFVKSSRFDAPAAETVEEYNMTWGEESFSEDGPIHLSMSSFQYPGIKNQRAGLVEVGAPVNEDGCGGDAYGVIWYPTALDNATATRSYAVTGYWDPNKERRNLNIITGWRVDEVLFDEEKKATGIIMSERTAKGQFTAPERVVVNAGKEVIVSAGALHSPQVLQRSGIGGKALLEEAGIDLLVDLPGVGTNLQDHAVAGVSWKFETNVMPNPQDSMAEPEFVEWATTELRENHSGPMRIATGNTGGLIPLPIIDPDNFESIVDEYLGLDLAEYLPSEYSAESVAGYELQRKIMSDMMLASDNAFLELPFFAGPSYSAVLIKVLSRGTVMLDPADKYADPIVDYHTYGIPSDRTMMRSILRFVRRFHQSASMQELGAVEVSPGADLVTDDEIDAWLRKSTSCSTAHNSGTNPMMPRELGGVVGPDLKVYGVDGLSVADSSVMPIIPGAHICASVYAVAEKAADIVKERHGLKMEPPAPKKE